MTKKIELLLFIVLVVFNNQKLFSQTQSEINEEICDDMLKIEKELENVVKKIREKYYNDTLFLKKLDISQKRWLEYRESQIELKFPEDNKQLEYGELYQVCYCLEKIKITEQRIKELEMWVKGQVDGNVCPGSVLKEK